jgi:hypothetical protein
LTALPKEVREALARVHDRSASETDLQRVAMRYARDHGWRRHHSLPARVKDAWVTPLQGEPGLPDLLLVRRGRLVIAELKRERGQTSDEQDIWLRLLGEVPGVETYVWRPRDWPTMKAVLI